MIAAFIQEIVEAVPVDDVLKDETLAEDWWSTVQNVGQVLVTLALPLFAAFLAVKKWGKGKLANWLRGVLDVGGDEEHAVATLEMVAKQNREVTENVGAQVAAMRQENTDQHRDTAKQITDAVDEIREAHRSIEGSIDEHAVSLRDHISRHDVKADTIDTKVDRVERTLDRLRDNLMRRE